MSHRAAAPPAKNRRFVRFVTIALLLLFMPIFVMGATVAATGTVTVSVQEKDGVNLWIPVPALLFDLAIFAAPSLIPADELADVRHELAPYHETLAVLAEELESIPAGSVLVEVDGGDEQVRIVKDWRSFDITVHSDDADIRVSVPARLLSRGLDIMG